jgi:hypothetical protein
MEKSNMSKSEKVKQVDQDANEGAAIAAAKRQNESETADGTRLLNVIPNNGKSLLSHPKGGE